MPGLAAISSAVVMPNFAAIVSGMSPDCTTYVWPTDTGVVVEAGAGGVSVAAGSVGGASVAGAAVAVVGGAVAVAAAGGSGDVGSFTTCPIDSFDASIVGLASVRSARLTPNRAAMPASVSPSFTVYVDPTPGWTAPALRMRGAGSVAGSVAVAILLASGALPPDEPPQAAARTLARTRQQASTGRYRRNLKGTSGDGLEPPGS